MSLKFNIQKKLAGKLGRVGTMETAHGVIETPAFVVVGTKATVKALTPEQVKDLGAQVTLANTYHLYLQPGDKLVKEVGGLHKFMNWPGPMMTDSGGFQAFSLGAAFGTGLGKFIGWEDGRDDEKTEPAGEFSRSGPAQTGRSEDLKIGPAVKFGGSALTKAAKITEDGVTFFSHIDGGEHKFTPESSMQIQANLGADIIFAFDECTSPQADHAYQKEAMDRTHRWAIRSLDAHKKVGQSYQNLFGIVQGGRFEDLRAESARFISGLDFDGFGIGGSFVKEDMNTAVRWVNEILPEEKPRHLLGVGEPEDLFGGIENGIDTFDCVAPTRMARNGALYTKQGKINILNNQFRNDLTPIDEGCQCYTCKSYTRAYVAHLFRAKEMLAGTLASIHNLYFIVNLVKQIRQSILDDRFNEFKTEFLAKYVK